MSTRQRIGGSSLGEGGPPGNTSEIISFTGRSLLAEVEAQAVRYRTRVAAAPLRVGERVIGTIHHYERSIGRIGAGVRDGVVLLSEDLSPTEVLLPLMEWARLWPATHFGTFRVMGGVSIASYPNSAELRERGVTAVLDIRNARELLLLSPHYDDFLRRLTRNTRQELRALRRLAAREGYWSVIVSPPRASAETESPASRGQ